MGYDVLMEYICYTTNSTIYVVCIYVCIMCIYIYIYIHMYMHIHTVHIHTYVLILFTYVYIRNTLGYFMATSLAFDSLILRFWNCPQITQR